MTCTILKTTQVLGKKWTVPLIFEISKNGHEGFNHILHNLKTISPKVLSTRLKNLEEIQIIEKNITNDKINYKITKKGTKIIELINEFANEQKHECINHCTQCPFYEECNLVK